MAVICQSCNGREFASFEALHRHMNDSKKAHHFCWSCTRDFPTRAALVDHASSRHSELTCAAPTCQRIFANEDALRRHLFDSPKHPKCRACGVGFRDVKAQSSVSILLISFVTKRVSMECLLKVFCNMISINGKHMAPHLVGSVIGLSHRQFVFLLCCLNSSLISFKV